MFTTTADRDLRGKLQQSLSRRNPAVTELAEERAMIYEYPILKSIQCTFLLLTQPNSSLLGHLLRLTRGFQTYFPGLVKNIYWTHLNTGHLYRSNSHPNIQTVFFITFFFIFLYFFLYIPRKSFLYYAPTFNMRRER